MFFNLDALWGPLKEATFPFWLYFACTCFLRLRVSFVYNLLHPRPEAKITENILGIVTEFIDISLALPIVSSLKYKPEMNLDRLYL